MATEPKAYPHPHVREDWLTRLREDPLEPALPIIDAHHHLWDRESGRYFLDDLLADARAGHDIRGTVYVQCGTGFRPDGPPEMRPVGETEFVLSIEDSIGENGKLVLWTHEKFGETGAWHHVYNRTMYGGSAVPAPGAIALLSLAVIGGTTRARRRT